ncbi:MAG: CPBP family intramembrane metalloprotease [Lachnospiraceae bacterium]|nr:CPBP family intramembrane metalloprotease [Lachnospiraceae bacterium]
MDGSQWEQIERAQLKMDRRHFSRIALGFLIYNLVGVGLQLVGIQFLQLTGWDYSPYRTTLSWILNFTFMYLLALPAAALYFKTVPRFGEVRHERWELGAWLVVFLIGLAMGYFGNIVGTLVSNFTGGVSIDYENLMDMIFEGNMFLTFLNVVIGAPIVEELLFRKFLIDRTIGYGEKLSVLLSGTLFGLMHGNFQQFFYAFALGCLFAYIYCKTGKIKNTILFHMWINFSGSILVPCMSRPIFRALSGQQTEVETLETMVSLVFAFAGLALISYMLLQLVAAVAGLVLFFVYKKYICFYPGLRQLPKGKRLLTVLVNPGMLAFVGLCIWGFF